MLEQAKDFGFNRTEYLRGLPDSKLPLARRTGAQKRIHETMAGLSDTSAFQTFERMAQKIEHTERLALAAAERLRGDERAVVVLTRVAGRPWALVCAEATTA